MRKLIFVLLVSFLALSALFSGSYALSEGSIEISIQNQTTFQGNLFPFSVFINKTSPLSGDATIECWIESPEGEKWAYSTTTVFMEALDSETISKEMYIFSSQPTGRYFLKVLVSFDEYSPPLFQSTEIYVLKSEIQTKGIIVNITSIPTEVSVESGWSKLISLNVKNNGDEILRNLTMSISGVPSTLYLISPEAYYNVEPNQEVVFSVRYTIPMDELAMDYTAIYTVFANLGFYDEKSHVVRIFTSRYALISHELERLGEEHQRISSKIQAKISNGFNVTLSQTLIAQAKTQLDFSEDYLKNSNYDNAMIALSRAESLISDADIGLSTANQVSIVQRTDYRLFIIFIALIPLSFFVYNMWQKRKLAKLLKYYSSEIMDNVRESVPGAKLRPKPFTSFVKQVENKMEQETKSGLVKKLDRTKKLLRLIERQYSSGAISEKAHDEIKNSLENKIELIEKKLKE
ncbi:MAG: hypothetical protein DRP29_08840 [Thermodesulfobacteriota bacterium]|nr:MAG: hypothetical protein DRP29_08840 [Thermodesulfobacteriota bacterium]